MSPGNADRNLLLGILAYQNAFITKEQLLAGMQAWLHDKGTPLAKILLDQGALDEPRLALLDALVDHHVQQHADDPQQSLQAVSSAASVRRDLEQLPDPDLQASIVHLSQAKNDDPYATASAGTPTSSGLRFRILRPHARGGLGEVFVAHDQELHREVALKEIQNKHADHPESRARFLLEAEITGGLEHPGIVPVYGLGTYADGRPFYAMRFIRGDSLMDAIKRFHSTSRDRKGAEGDHTLELHKLLRRLIDVCNALQYAHDRGVLHRDIKPGNIMLGKYGETLVVDWGLAKATRVSSEPERQARENVEPPLHPASASGSAETVAGSAIGTPAFMAPEQAAGRLDLLGPASDVYSLGATLYALLTGKPPVNGPVEEALQKARTGDIAPPHRLDPSIDRALEAICLKAMALRREDRYAAPRALADDIEHWLAGEAVGAYSEPMIVRARRWMRKHPGPVSGIAAAVLVAVVGLAIGAFVLGEKNQQLTRANVQLDAANAELKTSNQDLDAANRTLKTTNENLDRARRAAVRAADAEKLAAEKERRATALALKRLGHIEKANDLMASIFTDINPRLEKKGGPLLIEQLTKRLLDTADKLDEEAIGDPLTVARLQSFLGRTLASLGEPAKAIELHKKALATRAKLLGPDHPYTLTSMSNLASGYQDAGKLELALPLYEETLGLRKAKLGPDHPDTLISMNNVASAYRAAGKLDLALPLYEETLKLMRAKLGPHHPDTLTSMGNLADAYRAAGKLDLALALNEETLDLRKAKLGPDHPDTLNSMNNLAEGYQAAGKLDLALPLYEETLKLMRAKLGPDHPNTLTSTANLAVGYRAAGKLDLALPLYEETLKLQTAKLGPGHPDTLNSMNNLAEGYQAAGKLDLALPLYEDTLKLTKAKLGPDHPNTLHSMNNLAVGYEAAGKLDLALPLYEETLKLRKAKLGPDHPDTLNSMGSLAFAFFAAKEPAKAAPLFNDYLAVRRKQWGGDDPRFAGHLASFAGVLLKYEQHAAAEPMLRECLDIRAKWQPDAWSTFDTKAMLGASLLGQKKYNDAEQLLEQGYAGMKAREKLIPPNAKIRLSSAAERLVKLYEATDRKEEAANWAKIVAESRRNDGKLLDAIHDVGKELKLAGKLDKDIPALIYQVRLKAGVTYVIDMVSPDQKALDPYLYLRNEKGITLAEDDDSGGVLNARIIFRATADGVYQVRATSFNNGHGDFTLTVRPRE